MRPIIDGHLDLAMNALLYERDQSRPVSYLRLAESERRGEEPGTATVSLPELRRAGVALCFGTLIARVRPTSPSLYPTPRHSLDWPEPDLAHAAAVAQLAYYERLERRGELRLINSREQLEAHWQRWTLPADTALPSDVSPANVSAVRPGELQPGIVLAMEGADPVTEPEELAWWCQRGLRSLALAHYGPSRYAHGTGDHGPLTAAGRDLLKHMAELPLALDLTHLADRSFFEAYDACENRLYASHSNCRSLCPGQRQLTDEMIRLLAARDGVVGVAMFDRMLASPGRDAGPGDRPRVHMSKVAEHIDHICQITGSAAHVAIGSDLDGGFGAAACPQDLDTMADLHRLIGPLSERGYQPADLDRIFHGNWLRLLRAVLPREEK